MDRIQAIPTVYRGIQMRSKLEAAWARFMDEHATKWAYEPTGFDLDGVRYLPDFWLPDCRTFLEVKGLMDDASERKIAALVEAAAPRGITVVVGEAPAGERFHLRSPEDDGPYAVFGVCSTCFRGCFYAQCGGWSCRCCGLHNGDNGWRFRVYGDAG